MKRIVIFLILATAMMGGAIFADCSASTQATQENLIDQRVRLHLNKGTLLQALSILSVEKRVPIGFEPALTHKHQYHLTIDAENVSLQEVLEQIIQQEPGYRWELKDGVINIVPTKSRDHFVERFLNTRVREFEPPKTLGPFQIRDAIVALPEVVTLLRASGITASHYGYFYRHPSIYTNGSVDLRTSNTDVRGVLNKVVRESEHKMWIVSRSGNDLSSLDIGF